MFVATKLLFLLALAFVSVDCIRIKGNVKTDKTGFAYLGKFSFDFVPIRNNQTTTDNPGKVTLKLHVESKDKGPDDTVEPAYVCFYDDETNSWPTIYKKHAQCDHARNQSKHHDQHPIHWQGSRDWDLGKVYITQHIRPRFWYMAIADCERSMRGVTVSYDLSMTNQLEGSWTVEFGVSERHLNTMYILFFTIFFIAWVMQGNALWIIKREAVGGGIHPIVTLFTISLTFEMLANVLELSHWVKYTHDGIGNAIVDVFGDVFQILAHVTFVLLLILLAQGWTITTNEIKHKKQVLIGMAIFTISYGVTLTIQEALDPAKTTYIYLSPAGVVVVVLNALVGIWFIYTLTNSLKSEEDPEKRSLYKALGVLYSLWFWSLAIIAIIVALTVPPWYQDGIVAGISLSIDTLAYSVMLWLLWPSRSESYFRITASNVHNPRMGDHFEKL